MRRLCAMLAVVCLALPGCQSLQDSQVPSLANDICQSALLRSDSAADLQRRGRLLMAVGGAPADALAPWVEVACQVVSIAEAAMRADERGVRADADALGAARAAGLVKP